MNEDMRDTAEIKESSFYSRNRKFITGATSVIGNGMSGTGMALGGAALLAGISVSWPACIALIAVGGLINSAGGTLEKDYIHTLKADVKALENEKKTSFAKIAAETQEIQPVESEPGGFKRFWEKNWPGIARHTQGIGDGITGGACALAGAVVVGGAAISLPVIAAPALVGTLIHSIGKTIKNDGIKKLENQKSDLLTQKAPSAKAVAQAKPKM